MTMKMTAKISVVLNVVLSGALIYIWENRSQQQAAPVSPQIETQASAVVPAPAPAVVRQPVEAKPFRWSQLLSTNNDYRVFVANLREAGCPGDVVEAIVRNDAQKVFYAKRTELRVDGTQPGPWSVKSQLALVDHLLGRQQPAAVGAVNAPAPASLESATERAAMMPLSLRNVDLTPLELTPEQMQTIEKVRQDFWQQTGANQNMDDTNGPAYMARWQKAQLAADSTFRVTLGPIAYSKYLQMASAQAAEEQQSSQN